jgi:hypothetical protein
MIVIGCSQKCLEKALAVVNRKYKGNIKFKTLAPLNQKGNRYTFTLTVNSCAAPGHRLAAFPHERKLRLNQLDQFTLRLKGLPWPVEMVYKRLSAACWHVHGDMFDAIFKLVPETVIMSRGNKITRQCGNWEDYNIGSQAQPVYASEACGCGHE